MMPKPVWDRPPRPKKRVRVRRTKSVENFLHSDLYRLHREFMRQRTRVGHSAVTFPQSEEGIVAYVKEMKRKCETFRSWDKFLEWVSLDLHTLYSKGEWIDKDNANTFFDGLAYLPTFIRVGVVDRSYDVKLAQVFAMLIFGSLRTCVAAAERDSGLQALYHIFRLERHKLTPRKQLFRSTILLRLDKPQLTWPEAIQAANAAGKHIGQKNFERNFDAYLKGLRTEIAALREAWSNYAKE